MENIETMGADLVDDAVSIGDGYLRFEAGGVNFCVCLKAVARVLLLPALQPVPCSASYIVGLLAIGERTIPVIDLARRLKLPGSGRYTVETPLLLCERHGREIGLVISRVDGVADTAGVAPSEGQTRSRELFDGGQLPYVEVVNSVTGHWLVLDIDRLLGDSKIIEAATPPEPAADEPSAPDIAREG